MEFSEILDSMVLADDVWTATVPDTWMQGRSAFGGLQAAVALRAMRSLVPKDLPLRVLQVTFLAPVAKAVHVQARLLRSGKNVTHVEARLDDDGQTAAIVVGVFGRGRPSRVTVVPEQPKVDSLVTVDLPFIEGLSPSFLRYFTTRWLEGAPPFSGSTATKNVVLIGMHEEGAATEEHVLAIADLVPPVALSLLEARAAGSSLTWTLEILADRLDHLPLRGYRVDAELTAGRDGYTSQSVMVWGPGGEPVALSRQCMVVFG